MTTLLQSKGATEAALLAHTETVWHDSGHVLTSTPGDDAEMTTLAPGDARSRLEMAVELLRREWREVHV